MRNRVQRRLLPAAVLLLFLVWSPLADAAQASRHDVGYTWSTDIRRVLDAQDKLADLLDLEPGAHLQVVGRGREYGVVRGLQGTQAQANRLVAQRAKLLQQAGFTPAVIRSNSYHRLYHVR